MMKFVLSCFCLLLGFIVVAQNKQLQYDAIYLPQSLLLNPASNVSFDKHFGIPFFSGISFHAGSSEISLYDIFQTDGIINQQIALAIESSTNRDFFLANEQLELVSFGWRTIDSDTYFSGGMYQELDAIIYFPKDLATLAYNGNAAYINYPFQFSDLSVAAELLSVYHFGMNVKINEKLRLGARAKIYSSVINVNSTDNRGEFITRTTPEGPNIYSHEINDLSITANTAGILSLTEDNATPGSTLLSRAILSSNAGVGFDAGMTYTLSQKLTMTASILDVGFVAHRNDLRNYRISGSYDLDGIDFEFPALLNGTETTAYWEELEDEIDEQLPFEDELTENYTTWRPIKFNASLNYGFGENLSSGCSCYGDDTSSYTNRLGAHFFAIKRPRGMQAALTGYFDKRWNQLFTSRFTYTVDSFSYSNIGAMVSLNLNKFNVYLAADNFLSYPNLAKANGASFQLGFQLIFDNEE